MRPFVHLMVAALVTGAMGHADSALADDGQSLVRSVSSPPGVTENPEPEGEHASIELMNFHVPAQAASGELVPVEYNNIDDELVKKEERAKPLISSYIYGPVIKFDDPSTSGFPGHGRRDAFGAVSLDDGETWKVQPLELRGPELLRRVDAPPRPGLAARHRGVGVEGGALHYRFRGDLRQLYEHQQRPGQVPAQGP
ncbi:MAG: hypothetical protein JRJ84_17525, partial [Deltaproteobacteria bacterium]|nr:hypothetical protein [Deltaproteobacteria bacterium]